MVRIEIEHRRVSIGAQLDGTVAGQISAQLQRGGVIDDQIRATLAEVAVGGDLQGAAVNARAAAIFVITAEDQTAEVGFHQHQPIAGAGLAKDRFNGRGIVLSRATGPDAQQQFTGARRLTRMCGRFGGGISVERIAFHDIAVGVKLCSGEINVTFGVIHGNGTAFGGKHGERFLRPRRVTLAGGCCPVVVALIANRHPFAIAAVNLAVAFNARFTVTLVDGCAVPELQRDAVGVDQVDLFVDRGLDKNVVLILTVWHRAQLQRPVIQRAAVVIYTVHTRSKITALRRGDVQRPVQLQVAGDSNQVIQRATRRIRLTQLEGGGGFAA